VTGENRNARMIRPPDDDKPETRKQIDLDAYSIEEFCRRHSISRSAYYNLKQAGKGPREGHALGRILITKESAQQWREMISA
jgi:hypothetical protein